MQLYFTNIKDVLKLLSYSLKDLNAGKIRRYDITMNSKPPPTARRASSKKSPMKIKIRASRFGSSFSIKNSSA
jgi:hypothetical protein